MSATAATIGSPNEPQLRDALDRVITSEVFRNSPQLGVLLRYLVEAVLRGEVDRIKGYTIGVEALGRDAKFDPQSDPIVRVEATRLRRAIERYYAGPGLSDAIVIELPRGGYVPRFQFRVLDPAPAPAAWQSPSLLGSVRSFVVRYTLVGWLLLFFGAVFAVLDLFLGIERPLNQIRSALKPPDTFQARHLDVAPIVSVEASAEVGAPPPLAISASVFRKKLLDAFARFSDVNVVAEPAPQGFARPPGYRLTVTVESQQDATFDLSLRLLDVADGRIIWSKSYDDLLAGNDPKLVRTPIIREVATTLLEPFGIIEAREFLKRAATDSRDASSRCLIDSHEYFRSFNPDLHAGVRACLERMVADNPISARGLLKLARVYLREYQFGAAGRPGDPAVIDSALARAMRAIELNPNNARAYFVLLEINMARGDFEAAKATGEKSISLNPHDMTVAFHYGAALVLLGEVDTGLGFIRQVSEASTVPQVRREFISFVAAYLRSDLARASHHANRMTSNTYLPGYLARALVASRMGDGAGMRQAVERLIELQPAWRIDPRGELKKLIPLPALVDLMASDLAAGGIPLAASHYTR